MPDATFKNVSGNWFIFLNRQTNFWWLGREVTFLSIIEGFWRFVDFCFESQNTQLFFFLAFLYIIFSQLANWNYCLQCRMNYLEVKYRVVHYRLLSETEYSCQMPKTKYVWYKFYHQGLRTYVIGIFMFY